MTEWLKIVPLVLSCLSISIAVCAFLVGYRNFRLSRFPHARIVPDCFHRQSIKGPPDHYLEVEIESWGLPIYDLKVVLEVDFAENRRVNFRLAALGTVPNPTNAGQVVKFQLSGRAVKEALTKRSFESMGISDLPLGSVRIAVYGSG